MINNKCDDCAEPTRYVTACWDGYDKRTKTPTYGYSYSCNNTDCEEKQAQIAAHDKADREREEVHRANAENGIDAKELRKARLAAEIITRKAAEMIGLATSQYSGWENERAAIPPESYRRLIDEFSKHEPDRDAAVIKCRIRRDATSCRYSEPDYENESGFKCEKKGTIRPSDCSECSHYFGMY